MLVILGMSPLARFLILWLLFGIGSADASDYQGAVGKMAAVFSIDFNDDGTVSGTYSYPARKGVVYRLAGSNPRQGELYLEEYTGQALSARCYLSKKVVGSTVIWEGTMKNTDGRQLAMSFSRKSSVVSEPVLEISLGKGKDADGVNSMSAAKLVPPAWYASVEREVNWNTFPKANVYVEKVPTQFPDQEHVTAKVKSFTTRPGYLELVYVLGIRSKDDFEHVLYEGQQVTFRAARHVPIPEREIVGKVIYLQHDTNTGALLALTLHGIAVTHVRQSDSGKFEIRGILDTGEFDQIHEPSHGVKQETLERADFMAIVPDKLALTNHRDLGIPYELYFQELRIVRDYGISIQVTAAGPGTLELEGLSLDEPNEQRPWIFLGGGEPWGNVPASQHTDEAG